MNEQNKVVISVIALSLALGGAVIGGHTALAQESSDAVGSRNDSLIAKIVEKFNLNEDAVKSFFEEAHQERKQERTAQHEEILTQAVADGALTQEQKQLIIDKNVQWRLDRDVQRTADTSLTRDEMRQKMEKHRSEMTQWAQDNGIDEKYLVGNKGGHRGGFNGNRGPSELK